MLPRAARRRHLHRARGPAAGMMWQERATRRAQNADDRPVGPSWRSARPLSSMRWYSSRLHIGEVQWPGARAGARPAGGSPSWQPRTQSVRPRLGPAACLPGRSPGVNDLPAISAGPAQALLLGPPAIPLRPAAPLGAAPRHGYQRCRTTASILPAAPGNNAAVVSVESCLVRTDTHAKVRDSGVPARIARPMAPRRRL